MERNNEPRRLTDEEKSVLQALRDERNEKRRIAEEADKLYLQAIEAHKWVCGIPARPSVMLRDLDGSWEWVEVIGMTNGPKGPQPLSVPIIKDDAFIPPAGSALEEVLKDRKEIANAG